MTEIEALSALTRFGLGARPGDIERIATDPRAALLAEIADRDAALLKGRRLPSTIEALTAVRELQQERRAARQATGEMPDEAEDMAAMDAEMSADEAGVEMEEPASGERERRQQRRNYGLRRELPARLRRIAEAEIGFAERLVAFWANHFAIEADNGAVLRGIAGAYEREAIRPHVLGRFSDMLLAATQHPAMLRYLNNATSIGPNSRAGERRDRGLNENHAREIMELHTLGVHGGYTQADVISLANILTGWTYGNNPKNAERFGVFAFQNRLHEPGPQTLLGETFKQKGVKQGEAALAMLAARPETAEHIATKLVRHFIADTPPPELVASLKQTFVDTEGDLQAVSQALIESEEAWTSPAKFRSPQEFVFASIRALGVIPKPQLVTQALNTLGQPLLNPPSPAGFNDDSKTWLAPDAMTTRLDVAELLAQEVPAGTDPRQLAESVLGPGLSSLTAETIARAESPAQGIALLLMSPEFQRR